MDITMERISDGTLRDGMEIWNKVVEEGVAFPQTEPLTEKTAADFFAQQSYAGVARDDGTDEIVGVYVLHPNNIGRCGHICNASYAVKPGKRGHRIGEALVRDCMTKAKGLGFRILQFNAVVRSNRPALRLYERLGFVRLGVIPGGFLNIFGEYEDIIPHYIVL